MRKLMLLKTILICLFVLTGCKEVQEGADGVADKVTGKQDLETMNKMKTKLNNALDQKNKADADALKQLEK
ncbi:MAG: hypothetical protein NE334_01305 [Lentisphaeraceae bacterium]|nr:hypothetical protein [Lentisphaeraceae bacterium]